MIEGLVPQIALVLIVIGSWVGVALHALGHWWRTAIGKNLMAYLLIIAIWYTEILAATIYGEYTPTWQAIQAITFLVIPVVIWWRNVIALTLKPWNRPAARRDDGASVTDPG